MFFGTVDPSTSIEIDRDWPAFGVQRVCACVFCSISGQFYIIVLTHQFSYFCIEARRAYDPRAHHKIYTIFHVQCQLRAKSFGYFYVRECIMHVICKLNFDRNRVKMSTRTQLCMQLEPVSLSVR